MDEVITFKPLDQQTLEGIAALMLDEYKPSMEAKGIRYSYTPAALHALVVKSQGGKFGARDLRRVIRKAVEDPENQALLAQIHQFAWFQPPENYTKWARSTFVQERTMVERTGLQAK